MLTIQEALDRCLEAVCPVVVEEVPLEGAYGRVLAEDVYSGVLVPPWDNSAMDGFAVRSADLPGESLDCDGPQASGEGVVFEVLETIPAGAVARHALRPGAVARIMTGASLPMGADAIVLREDSAPEPPGPEGEERVRLRGGAPAGQHVRRAGEELRPGDRLLASGAVLSPAAVGLCASVGRTSVTVARKPRVALIATGDEVVAPGQPRGPGQIWSSNTLALAGLVLEAGGVAVDCGIAPDTLEGTRLAFRRALGCDFIVSTGGVSVGDFDVVKQALAEEGAEMRFWKVRMKPGKPLAFGVIGGRPAFGLPGNPVSCAVNFLQFVRPVLRRSLGDPRPFLPVLDATLRGSVRKAPGREELVRVHLSWEASGLVATPTGAQGSSLITSLVRGHGLALLASDCTGLEDGARVAVQIYDPGFLAGEAPDYRW